MLTILYFLIGLLIVPSILPAKEIQEYEEDSFYRSCAIMITCYNRPHYLRPVLKALRSNPETSSLPIYFFLDGGEGATQRKNRRIIQRLGFPHAVIIKRQENFGCEKNIISSLRTMFEEKKFDRVIVMEDDQVVSRNYIRFLRDIHRWCETHRVDTGMITGNAICTLNLEEKIEKRGHLHCPLVHLWAYCMERSVWDRIKDNVHEYQERFLDREDENSQEYFAEIRAWIRAKASEHGEPVYTGASPMTLFFDPNLATGQDMLIYFSLWEQDLLQITPVVNRMLNIGRIGVHFRDKEFDSYFAGMRLHELPEVESEEFVWVGK